MVRSQPWALLRCDNLPLNLGQTPWCACQPAAVLLQSGHLDANSHDRKPHLFWFLVFLAPHRRRERLTRSPQILKNRRHSPAVFFGRAQVNTAQTTMFDSLPVPDSIAAAPQATPMMSPPLAGEPPMQSKSTAETLHKPQDDKTSRTDNARIKHIVPLPPPEHLIRFFPIADTPVEALVAETRQALHRIIHGDNDRLLLIIGPCSIHDPKAALDYARRLAVLRQQHAGELEVVMRVYFEKPRTTVGWKGLINDPYLDESFRIDEGLRIARELLIDINRLGVPAGSEFLDVISPQYIADLISWGAIGARTTESQVHRELASGLSAPIGFKNGTDGSLRIATDAIHAARRPHSFLSVHKNGQVAIVQTRGNKDTHVILRGGKTPNYDAASVRAACAALEDAKLDCRLMIDCSHANSAKQHMRQLDVARDIAAQLAAGERCIFGVMAESHLQGGAQKFTAGKDDPTKLSYGQSITDACLPWDESVELMQVLADGVKARRKHKQGK
jgi:3-deoxy-7-phosphoheptulonate synthase